MDGSSEGKGIIYTNMTFTMSFFLIGLLPWFIFLFNIIGKKEKIIRILLILANSLFYVWGGAGAFIFICGYSVVIWLFSSFLRTFKNKCILVISIICSVIPLLFVKYTDFIAENLNYLFNRELPSQTIVIPIGISFFTFEAVSLLADIYKNNVKEPPNLIDVYLYLTFFPTVTSGPIIRYKEFEEGLAHRFYAINYTDSIERIVIGLYKKVFIADKIAILADYYFDGIAAGNSYSCIGLWIGSIAYTLQLYFDFSGYSDMAIGIGRLLGFDLRENFNKPYQASSISNFWKRWHISLTQWFRDYIYIPLGGNRCAIPRHIFNMLVVWLLTGIWHGADWTFIIWGLGYFILLLIEKYIPVMKKMENNAIGHFYTLFFVNLLWVPFRAGNLNVAVRYVTGMFGGGIGIIEDKAVAFIPFLVIAILLCFTWNGLFGKIEQKQWFIVIRRLVIVIMALLAICAVVNSAYAPYIYGNF